MHSELELTWWGTTMNSGFKISEAVLYIIRFNGSTVERRLSFSHWIHQTFGGSRTLFTEEILCVGISLVNKVPDLYFYIAYCWNLCWTARLKITSSFSVSECHFHCGQLVILFRSKWNSLRSNFDRMVNLFHALWWCQRKHIKGLVINRKADKLQVLSHQSISLRSVF